MGEGQTGAVSQQKQLLLYLLLSISVIHGLLLKQILIWYHHDIVYIDSLLQNCWLSINEDIFCFWAMFWATTITFPPEILSKL